jgi:hypothetical protein
LLLASGFTQSIFAVVAVSSYKLHEQTVQNVS